MDAQQFLAEFGHIANAPGGLVRLREMVLALAVQGRLIAQDSNDSPASELLKNITAGKRDVSNNSKSKLPNTLSKISTSDMPFEKPQGWEWVRLGDIAEIERGGSPRPIDDFLTNDPDGLSWIKIGDTVKGSKFITSTREKIKKEGLVKTRMVYPGDFLLTNSMSFGRPYITNIEGCIHDGWLRIHPPSCLEKDYLYHLLSSPFVANFFLKSAAGAVVQNLNADKVRELPVPLPPLDEQARIVAKVDELMALCDRLEQQQQQRRKLQNALRQSMLQAVATATSPHELQTTWSRLADNFGQLFSAPEDVVALQQLAMDLAVRGLLTEQRQEDEAASFLLERIAIEHKQKVLNGKMKRPKPLSKIDPANAPFDLPNGWTWARFPELGVLGRGKSKHRPRNDPKLFNPGVYPLVQTGEVARSNGIINEYHSKYSDIGLAQSMLWPKGTLCITIAANIADTAILGFDACFPDSVVGFIPAYELREDVEYFLLFMKTARERLLAFAPSTAQKNINLEILQSILIPVPPKAEITRIISRVKTINALCERLAGSNKKAEDIGKLFAISSVASLTGITTERKQDNHMKAPQTELIAPIRLGETPDIKAQAPLAKLLTRHNGEMSAKDLWQRYGGEIDAFYAQLKTEVAHGWIQEPEVAEMRQVAAERAEA